jgi:hypothetical protein
MTSLVNFSRFSQLRPGGGALPALDTVPRMKVRSKITPRCATSLPIVTVGTRRCKIVCGQAYALVGGSDPRNTSRAHPESRKGAAMVYVYAVVLTVLNLAFWVGILFNLPGT